MTAQLNGQLVGTRAKIQHAVQVEIAGMSPGFSREEMAQSHGPSQSPGEATQGDPEQLAAYLKGQSKWRAPTIPSAATAQLTHEITLT